MPDIYHIQSVKKEHEDGEVTEAFMILDNFDIAQCVAPDFDKAERIRRCLERLSTFPPTIVNPSVSERVLKLGSTIVDEARPYSQDQCLLPSVHIQTMYDLLIEAAETIQEEAPTEAPQ